MQAYYLLIKYNGQVFYKTLAELPDGSTVKNISIQLLPATEQSVQADGATPRAYCKVHETYYDVSMGCAACPPRR